MEPDQCQSKSGNKESPIKKSLEDQLVQLALHLSMYLPTVQIAVYAILIIRESYQISIFHERLLAMSICDFSEQAYK